MAIYITQGRYTREAVQGMVAKPEDRRKAVEGLAKAAGAELLDYFVTYGEYDFLVIMQSGRGKGDADTMAALMTAAATGGGDARVCLGHGGFAAARVGFRWRRFDGRSLPDNALLGNLRPSPSLPARDLRSAGTQRAAGVGRHPAPESGRSEVARSPSPP